MTIIFKEESYDIQGAVFEVYRQMGSGFLEEVYQECLEREFKIRDIPFEPQKHLTLFYKGEPLNKTYIPDFVCYEKIIVELKAVKELTNDHQAQILNYLKATQFKLGLLVNFGSQPTVTIERLVF
ncbi:MAG: GxxExxY protein [Planctomycetaceae bacterium]|jgi:GxxExxY protein|nr:GxxExxY protein [Planctomycetaceae bacterium]